jgi:hypothetical protein
VQWRPDIAEADERRMAEWGRLYPGDVETELQSWTQKKAERIARRREKRRRRKAFIEAYLVDSSTIHDDERWDDLFLTSEESSEGSSDDGSFEKQ